MYENWIKFEKLTLEKPEIYHLASLLKLEPHAVIGKLLTIWAWFDDHTENGTAPVSVIPMLDSKTCKGFCAAMQDPSVRWLKVENSYISICNYDKHNGLSAKKRANDQRRKQKSRSNSQFRHSKRVTYHGQMSQQRCDEQRTPVRMWSHFFCAFLGLARSSQFSFSFFLYQGKDSTTGVVLGGGISYAA